MVNTATLSAKFQVSIPRAAVAAARVSAEHNLPLADAVVYATARAHDADILPSDAHFKDLPHVILIEKRT